MLQVVVPEMEWFNDGTNEITHSKETTLMLEHSLISVSRWESKHKVPFLSSFEKGLTREEFIDYVRCMTINKSVNQFVYYSLTPKIVDQIREYIQDPMTATTIHDYRKKTQRRAPAPKVITSEQIYSWMAAAGVSFDCEKWHLNRLLMLLQVCAIENGSSDKMSKKEVMKQNAALNAMRQSKRPKRRR